MAKKPTKHRLRDFADKSAPDPITGEEMRLTEEEIFTLEPRMGNMGPASGEARALLMEKQRARRADEATAVAEVKLEAIAAWHIRWRGSKASAEKRAREAEEQHKIWKDWAADRWAEQLRDGSKPWSKEDMARAIRREKLPGAQETSERRIADVLAGVKGQAKRRARADGQSARPRRGPLGGRIVRGRLSA
jgi:hypothetical protein